MNRAVALAITLGVLTAGSSQADTIKVAAPLALAPLEIAVARGYFKDQGLDVEVIRGAASGQDFMASLATNQIQVINGSPNVALFNALNRGVDIRMVASAGNVGKDDTNKNFGIVVRSDLLDSGQVKTLADLKGRKVGAGPTKGAFNYIFTVEALEKGGLTEKDASLEVLGFAESVVALSNKALDAAAVVEPFIAQAKSRNIARLLISASEVHPGGVGSVLQFSPAFAAKKDDATKFMVAYLKGVRDYTDAFFANKDRDAVIKILAENTPIKDAKLWEAMSPLIVDVNGEFSVEDMMRQAEFHKKQGTLTGTIPDLNKYVDTSFIKAAVEKIGRR